MRKITGDFSHVIGKISALHGVNNGPRTGNFYIDTSDSFREAGIPFSRLHDTEYPFGSAHYVDIHCVFPNEDADPADPASYDFALTDAYLQAILDTGAQIIYRLGNSIEHGPVKVHVVPPKDFEKWAEICAGIVRHCNEGWANGHHWNIRYWEIWNEPEGEKIGRKQMWTGTDEEYFRLYVTTARRLKKEFPDLRIGGYASCGFYATTRENPGEWNTYMTEYAEEFFDYISDPAHAAPLDFFSWHLYSGIADEYGLHAAHARKLMAEHGFGDAESILDEWNFAGEDMFEKMQRQEGAALYTAAMCRMQENGVDIATNYDGQPMLNYCGIFRHTDFKPTKSFYSLKAWDKLYRLGGRAETSVEGRSLFSAAAVGEKGAALVLSSYAGNGETIPMSSNASGAESDEPVEVFFKNLPWKTVRAEVYATDAERTEALVTGGTFTGDFSLILPVDGYSVRLVKLTPVK